MLMGPGHSKEILVHYLVAWCVTNLSCVPGKLVYPSLLKIPKSCHEPPHISTAFAIRINNVGLGLYKTVED